MRKHNEDLSLGPINSAIERMTCSPLFAFAILMIILIVAFTGQGQKLC
jgi:hypothetical protein